MTMIRISIFFLVGIFVPLWMNAQLLVSSVECENKLNPLGIKDSSIRFSWELGANENDQYQIAYQLVVGSSLSDLINTKNAVWNSSIVKSSQSILIEYKGQKLQPAQTYFWCVRVWDKNNKPSEWSNTQQFTTALFTEKDWANAKWIGYEELPDSMRIAPAIHAPLADQLGKKGMQRSVVPLFRKQFSINKKVKTALLFVSGLGQYEININGSKIGSAFLAPGWTYYDKTVLYNTYNITDKLSSGKNAIAAIVGNGFYYINRERYFKIVSAFGMPRMICRLKITYDDGSIENIVSDKSWKTTVSPITFSSIYGGEDYNAQMEENGWNTANFNDTKWKNVLLVKAPFGKLEPEQTYPVSLINSFTPKGILQTAPGKYLYDFGQNVSGIVQLKVKGTKGQVIKLVPSELINANLSPNQSASGEPYYYTYTLKGSGEEIWQPKFTYYGFRYVQVEGAVPDTASNTNGLPVITKLTSLHNRNSNPVNGSFECSNELFNKIYTLINWSIKSNLQSVVTDCPHREKLGWLEQDYLMGASIHYNFDIYNLYRKIVLDMMDAQYSQGFVPDIAPEFVQFSDGFLDSPEWGSACVIIPWLLYEWYGDKDILQKAYPMMKKYVAYLETKASNHILSHGLGDWFDYGPNRPGEAQLTPKAVTATSVYYYDAKLLSQIANVLNNEADATTFEQLAAAIKNSFNSKFFNAATNVYSTGSQTAMAMPLCVGLVDGQNKDAVLKNLVDSIYANNKALTAGDIGFHFLIKALDDGGASQLIYDMNNRDDVPGYGFQLKKGATALTESWPALQNVSNNHLMLGHVMEWFYSGLAGIEQESNSIGFQTLRIRPQPVGDITSASGSFHSPYGWVKTSWRKEGSTFTLSVTIPPNSQANVYLPVSKDSKIYEDEELITPELIDGAPVIKCGSGSYRFVVK